MRPARSLELSQTIDARRAERASKRAAARQTPRTVALRAIPPGSYLDFEVKDAHEAASLRGSVYHTLGRGQAWVEQLSHKTVRVYRDAR